MARTAAYISCVVLLGATSQLSVASAQDLAAQKRLQAESERLVDPELAGIKCGACKAMVTILRGLGKWGNEHLTLPVANVIGPWVCEKIKATGDCDPSKNTKGFKPCVDLCKGMVSEEGKVIVELLTDKNATKAGICSVIKGACPPPAMEKIDWSQPPLVRSDVADFAGEMKPERWTNKKKRTQKFCHLSDQHLQLDYVVGNEADCGQPICCRSEVGRARATNTSAGIFGADGCDTPLSSLEAMLDHMAEQDCDFVLQTGDDPAHDIWHQTFEGNVHSMTVLTAALKKRFPKIPVVSILGNHGSVPVNQYRGPGEDAWLYDSITANWGHWLPEQARETLRFGGFYAMRVLPKLWTVNLHSTMLVEGDNWHLDARRTDWARQLVWVKDTLDQIQARGDKVLWLMHHPLGASLFSEEIKYLMHTYQDMIVASFVGHAHNTFFVAPASPPIVEYCTGGDMGTGLNPTYRVFEYSVDEHDNVEALTDFVSYFSDFDQNNRLGKADFRQIARATTDYQIQDLSHASWRALASSWLLFTAQSNATYLEYSRHSTRAKVPASQQNQRDEACKALCTPDAACLTNCTGKKLQHVTVSYDPSVDDVCRDLPVDDTASEVLV